MSFDKDVDVQHNCCVSPHQKRCFWVSEQNNRISHCGYINDTFFDANLSPTKYICRLLVHGAVCCWKRGKVSAGRTTRFIKWAALGLYFMVLTLRHLQKLRSRFQHFPTLAPLCNPALISDKTCGHLHWLSSHTLYI